MRISYVINKEICDFNDLRELCWSGAISRLDTIDTLGLQDEFMNYLDTTLNFDYDDHTLTDTEINDFIWFECDDWIEEHKGDEDNE